MEKEHVDIFLCWWLLEWEAHDVSPGNADSAKHKKDEDKRPEAAVGVEGHPGVKDVDEDGVDEGDAEVDDEVPGKVGQPEDKRIHSRHQLNLPFCDLISIFLLRIMEKTMINGIVSSLPAWHWWPALSMGIWWRCQEAAPSLCSWLPASKHDDDVDDYIYNIDGDDDD